MKTKPEIETKIFSSNIKFEDVVVLVKRVKELEEEHNFEVGISFDCGEGYSYRYRSASELIRNPEDDNIEYLSKHVVITGLRITKHGDFSFSVYSGGHHVSLTRTTGSLIGIVFVDCVISTLKLRTSSVFGYLDSHVWPVVMLQIPAGATGVITGQPVFSAFGIALSFALIYLSGRLKTCRITMGTSKDAFVIRKKDDVVIALCSLIVGVLLGVFVPKLFP